MGVYVTSALGTFDTNRQHGVAMRFTNCAPTADHQPLSRQFALNECYDFPVRTIFCDLRPQTALKLCYERCKFPERHSCEEVVDRSLPECGFKPPPVRGNARCVGNQTANLQRHREAVQRTCRIPMALLTMNGALRTDRPEVESGTDAGIKSLDDEAHGSVLAWQEDRADASIRLCNDPDFFLARAQFVGAENASSVSNRPIVRLRVGGTDDAPITPLMPVQEARAIGTGSIQKVERAGRCYRSSEREQWCRICRIHDQVSEIIEASTIPDGYPVKAKQVAKIETRGYRYAFQERQYAASTICEARWCVALRPWRKSRR